MHNLPNWFYIVVSVLVALTANTLSAIWARNADKFSFWLVAVLAISPLVFLSFGYTTSKIGIAVSSGTIDSLLTITTIVMGLVAFNEWDKLSVYQYIGIVLALFGVFLMVYFPKPTA